MKKQPIILMLVLLGVLLAGGCGKKKPPRPLWAQTGAFARVKMTGEKVQMRGMRYYSKCEDWWVTCLIKRGRTYRDGVVSRDSYVAAYSTFNFWLKELEPCRKETAENKKEGSKDAGTTNP